jgi:hypothetical protein
MCPVADEFSGAGSPGRSRSELSPVSPECPIATRPIRVRSPESGLIEVPSVEGEPLVPPQPPTTIAHRQATTNGLARRYLRGGRSARRTTMQVAMLLTLEPVSGHIQITVCDPSCNELDLGPRRPRSSARIHRTPSRPETRPHQPSSARSHNHSSPTGPQPSTLTGGSTLAGDTAGVQLRHRRLGLLGGCRSGHAVAGDSVAHYPSALV